MPRFQPSLLNVYGRALAIRDYQRQLCPITARVFWVQKLMLKNGLEHITPAPYHASSNGCAERAVQTFKLMMKKAGDGNLNTKVSWALFSNRITPQSTTGLSPAEMLQGRRLRSTLDQIHPDRPNKGGKHPKETSWQASFREKFPWERRSDHKKFPPRS